MTQAVLIPNAIMAMNVDSLNRHFIDYGASASNIDNGNIFVIDSRHTSGSLTEVFEIKQPTSASPANVWMAYSGDEIVLTASKYKGLDPDPRNFYNAANYVFDGYKPMVGDVITLTADAFANTWSSHTHAAPIADNFKLNWESAAASSGLCYKYLGTTYISIHNSGSTIANQRVTAYLLECVSI